MVGLRGNQSLPPSPPNAKPRARRKTPSFKTSVITLPGIDPKSSAPELNEIVFKTYQFKDEVQEKKVVLFMN